MRSLCLLMLFIFAPVAASAAEGMFEIHVVDEQTGRGIPMVELRTVDQARFYTDSNGYVAIRDEEFLNRKIHFLISSHGYEFPLDGVGFHGTDFVMKPGESITLKMKRLNIAERLYRLTGLGIYHDSRLLGKKDPLRNSVFNGQVVGCDGALGTIHGGRILWLWGDTARPDHILGNYQASLAFSELPGKVGLDPEVGVNYEYVLNPMYNQVKAAAPMPGEGPTWVSSLATIIDEKGNEKLYGYYVKYTGEDGEYKSGLALYDEAKEEFVMVRDFNRVLPNLPHGTAIRRTIDGVDWLYFCEPMSQVRVRADLESMIDSKTFESFSGLAPGAGLRDQRMERGRGNAIVYGWKKNTPSVSPPEDQRMVANGLYRRDESWNQLRDRDTGKEVIPQHGTVAWNEHRKRWIAVFSEINGQRGVMVKPPYTGPPILAGNPAYEGTILGEVWYTEADSPVGPWVYGVKVATHNNYSFYNPRHHSFFDKEGGRVIFFEGSYATIYSRAVDKTPRYDYNQLMYKLDLGDPRTAIPSAVYETTTVNGSRFATGPALGESYSSRVPFFAFDQEVNGARPIYETIDSRGAWRLVAEKGKDTEGPPVFYAFPADMKDPPATARPLFEYVNLAMGQRIYSTGDAVLGKQFQRSDKPFCLVFENPLGIPWTPDLKPPTK